MSHCLKSFFAALLALGACSQTGTPLAGPAAAGGASPHDGRALFTSFCATCHGPAGRGDGPAAGYLFPKPRDLTSGKFKVRSTPTGELPTDADLLATIDRGMPGSAMPSFSYLPRESRLALVDFVKGLAVQTSPEGKSVALFQARPPTRVVTVREEAACTPELVRRGRELYRAQGCVACHGEAGVGDGPAAFTLRDDWGYPVPPNNFTRGLYKGGSSPRDVYLRFTTGMTGTPMPSFESSLSDADRWALVHYVKSLEKPGQAQIVDQGSGLVLRAPRLARVPENPFDPAWDRMEASRIPLMHLWQRSSAPDLLAVRATHDGKSLALLLEWDDARIEGMILRPQDFPDASAVMFALGETPGHFAMGEKGKPCNIWQWRMDRQLDLAKFWDMEDFYPGMVSDDYPLSAGPKVHRPIEPAASHDPTFLTGRGAGNPASQTERVSAIQDLVSAGFGTLEIQPPAQQNVRGRGIWANGRWRVLFVRALSSSDEKDARFTPGGRPPIAFAVWDGGAGDRDGQKSVSYWQVLELAP